jgi:DNA-binding IscR family transcriptional regulator
VDLAREFAVLKSLNHRCDVSILVLVDLARESGCNNRAQPKEIQKGVSSVPQIAATAEISKRMTYNHLRELKAMGYIADGESGYIITDAGRIASI